MMKELIKPRTLRKGDTVATVSLSWGGAGDAEIHWRYEQGKKRLQEVFGLHVIEMPHTLSGSAYVYEHPEDRAADLMQAFADPSIKAVISCTGGNDSVRMLPYVDFDVLRKNPKIFTGYSDSTVTHYMCIKAGFSSFYGASVLIEFAENIEMYPYTKNYIQKALFSTEPLGEIPFTPIWTSEFLEWAIENQNTARTAHENGGYELLQGNTAVRGRLIGGCLDVLEMIKGTLLFPPLEYFDNAILFFETSEDMPPPALLECWLRWYGTMGIFSKAAGILFGKPYNNQYYEEYKTVICKILKECRRQDMPVLYNVSFGHTSPIITIPFGALAEINCHKITFSILEGGVSSGSVL